MHPAVSVTIMVTVVAPIELCVPSILVTVTATAACSEPCVPIMIVVNSRGSR